MLVVGNITSGLVGLPGGGMAQPNAGSGLWAQVLSRILIAAHSRSAVISKEIEQWATARCAPPYC